MVKFLYWENVQDRADEQGFLVGDWVAGKQRRAGLVDLSPVAKEEVHSCTETQRRQATSSRAAPRKMISNSMRANEFSKTTRFVAPAIRELEGAIYRSVPERCRWHTPDHMFPRDFKK